MNNKVPPAVNSVGVNSKEKFGIFISGFDNCHKTVVRNHVHVPEFWRTRRMWANIKKHISGIT